MSKPTFNVHSRGDYESKKISQNVVERLTSAGWGININGTPDFVIAVGGDGTTLEAFREYQFEPNYVGIHTGTLGFFADWGKEEYQKLVELMIKGEYGVGEYSTIKIDVHMADKTKTIYGVNDLSMRVLDVRTLVTSLYVNGEKFEVMRSDGLVISAPCGSTGYNHSLHGAVFHPSRNLMQITGIAPIANVEYRILQNPFILGEGEVLDIYPQNPTEDYFIGVDGKRVDISEIHKITVQLSENKIKFARYRPYPFWQRVDDKFIGGKR